MAKNSLTGICPGNPFFTNEEKLERFLREAAMISKKIYVFLPEKISLYNYLATHATNPRKRCHGDMTHLRGIADRILRRIASDQFLYLDWDMVEQNKDYQDNLSRIIKCYADDPTFTKDVNEATASGLESITRAKPGRYFTNDDIPTAAKFLFGEVAMVDSLWSILGWDASEEYWLLYHKGENPVQYFTEGKYSTKPISKVQFRCITGPGHTV